MRFGFSYEIPDSADFNSNRGKRYLKINPDQSGAGMSQGNMKRLINQLDLESPSLHFMLSVV